ncbi:MAG TPA: cytochrome P450 [Gemmataceae bacterium]|nr:cytochrome P450 [Gemmataceae bacterium]
MTAKYPPGPRDAVFGLTYIRQFRLSPLAFVTEMAQEYGDFVFARMGWFRVYFVNRPELVREILATKVKSFHKLRRQMKALHNIEGNGLVVSAGAPWRRHRPMVQPAFHASHFERYARLIVEHARRRVEHWSPDTTFDMSEEMNQLALEIIARVVFDVDWSDRAARLRAAVHVFREYMQREITSIVRKPDWLPLPGKLRQRRAVRAMDSLIWELIRERRSSGAAGEDMLALMLSAARGLDEVAPITDREIRDEAATLFVAGHDTTSAAMAWFWYALARHPEVARRVREEVDAVLGGRPATYEDVPRLRYTEMAVKESMRLYPAAAFLFGRQAVEDVELGGYAIRRNSWVYISPYVMHRDPRNFEDPEKFDPGRFAPGRADEIPDYAYVPFGGGPRICIGSVLATMEVVLVAATVLQRFQVSLAPDQKEVEPEIEIVLRPKGGLRMRISDREPKERSA